MIIGIILLLLGYFIGKYTTTKKYEHDYDMGWLDCEEAHRNEILEGLYKERRDDYEDFC